MNRKPNSVAWQPSRANRRRRSWHERRLPETRPARALIAGFTLVEMLVAVALVVLMMTMFAQIFQLATGSMTKQKAIAENDQRARTLVTIIKNDLNARTFVDIRPFFPTESPSLDPNITKRQGYFYISESDINDDTDDLFQFTADLSQSGTNDAVYFGKAANLLWDTANHSGTSTWPNQPEFDDGQALPDNSATSPRAEISYFLRNGSLYRRVMLIRQPILPASSPDGTPKSGADGSGPINLFTNPYEAVAGGGGGASFWADFDYSAYFSSADSKPKFHGNGDLNNATTSITLLSIPGMRFGFTPAGVSREFLQSGSGAGATFTFIGRFTQQETSSPAFGYPGWFSGTAMDTSTSLSLGADGVVTAYNNGTRFADDLLLSNVHAFDVKVWDEGIGQFLDLGHAVAGGNYNAGNRLNQYYGPYPSLQKARNNCFDTWNPTMIMDLDGDSVADQPPFRPRVNPADYTSYGIALKAIQIKIRFLDVTSNQMREVTIVHSLVSTS